MDTLVSAMVCVMPSREQRIVSFKDMFYVIPGILVSLSGKPRALTVL